MNSELEKLLAIWRKDLSISPNIGYWKVSEPKAAQLVDYPDDIYPDLKHALQLSGIQQLYTHQADAYQSVTNHRHVVIVTGTASGKSLCYNLPVVNDRLNHPGSTALYLFPTKALANDQLDALRSLISRLPVSEAQNLKAAVYDGDTPQSARAQIRKTCNCLFTNPDMLHQGILPQHTLWADFFSRLSFIIIDEIHTYRGVFGSHVANLIRRLKRIARFYHASPQFVLTSATIGNPQELAEKLIEEDVLVISNDGAPHDRQHFMIYNPPMVNPELGLRRSAAAESVILASDLIRMGVQTILFTKTRRSVELLLLHLNDALPGLTNELYGYRSGYLPAERRRIEQGLRTGDVKGVVSTNALELGIDIGGMEAAVIVGYPGTISSTRQQAGRAGRRTGSSAVVLVASSNPLDQFLVKHPGYLLDNSPEMGLINPDNLIILLHHLQCAAFELPFCENDGFGRLPEETTQAFLHHLVQTGQITHSGPRYYWIANQYPAESVSLRTTGGQSVRLMVEDGQKSTLIGEVDSPSAVWMVHPGAIYMHQTQIYRVENIDFSEGIAHLSPIDVDYFTEARQDITIEKISTDQMASVFGGQIQLGEISVTSQVTGYKKIAWQTRALLAVVDLEDIPPTNLRTVGFWLSLSEDTVSRLRELNAWTSDPNVYGPNWNRQKAAARQRDHFTCHLCGILENGVSHHVHHKRPFRLFESYLQANDLSNLITLCPACHRKVEANVRVQSGLAGLSYILGHLSPLFLMCDMGDLGVSYDPKSTLGDGQPTIALFDQIPGGIGLSNEIYQIYPELISRALDLVETCECLDGCPSCVGPQPELGMSGKRETIYLLKTLLGREI